MNAALYLALTLTAALVTAGTLPAWRALGETLRDAGQVDAARSAFMRVLELYQRLGVEQEIDYTGGLIAGLAG